MAAAASGAAAAAGRGTMPLLGAGALIAGAFWTLAWLAPRPGEPLFMAALVAATGGYLAAAVRLSRTPAVSPLVLAACLGLAVAWRGPLLTLPEASAHDAVRYLWDARVVEAGLSPYGARPDDPALASLHTDVTRSVDAAWLPTIYPPVAQLYFRLVAAIDHSVAAFRVAALASDLALGFVLAGILRATGQPLGRVLLYAWHPLPPVEGAGGAHVDLFGVLLLALSWLALLRLRTGFAALAFGAAVMVKPLPLVLAPLYWRRIRGRDALLAVASAGLATLWIAKGGAPWGSTGAFLAEFRFNGPLFAAIHSVLPPPAVAAAAVAAGLATAVWMRRTRDVSAPEAWAWPMALALLLSPVIYPWYLVWLIPFASSRAAAPVWLWTLSILAVYPTWHLQRLGAAFAVPGWLVLIELAIPAAAAIVSRRRCQAPGSAGLAHG
jgi:alpha-1,6-mannosyltransferase